MAGETNLETLLMQMQPKLLSGTYVFCTVSNLPYSQLDVLQPLATCQETEGLSLLLKKSMADRAGYEYGAEFRGITLSVHSSLEAVGFTAAIASKLASVGISANVIAAYYHDHVFIPTDQAELALKALSEFQQ